MIYLLAYTRLQDDIVKENEELVINSLHLAYFEGNQYTCQTVFKALNYNTGILFGKALNRECELVSITQTLLRPRIYRLQDGSFCIQTTRGTKEGKVNITDKEQEIYIKTRDFIHFAKYEWVDQEEHLKTEESDFQVEYRDMSSGKIKRITVKGTTAIEISEGELDILKQRYGSILDHELLMENVTEHIDYSSFQIDNYADPIVQYHSENDKYYFMGTTGVDGNITLTIREADTVVGLSTAKACPIKGKNGYSYEIGVNQDDRKLLLWAPELHKIGKYWYCLFTSGGENWYQQSSYIMKNSSGNLMDESSWETPELMRNKDGIKKLYEHGITLDMTYLENQNQHYVIWAQRETTQLGGRGLGSSDLFIATIDPEKPSVITSEPVRIAVPEYGWEKRTTDVLEGPFVTKKGNSIYLVYSASGVDATYCVGCLVADQGSDLLSAESWYKMPSPLLTTENGGEKGPGHCSFCVDRSGNEIFIYHFFPGSYKSRSARARQLRWSNLGIPVLNENMKQK